jgi:hypothetical protein
MGFLSSSLSYPLPQRESNAEGFEYFHVGTAGSKSTQQILLTSRDTKAHWAALCTFVLMCRQRYYKM